MKNLFTFIFAVFSLAAFAEEHPIGDPVEKNNLKVAAVYFAAVPMDHSAMMKDLGGAPMDHAMMASITEKDIAKEKFAKKGAELIHLEADIHATKDNKNGFGNGEWIPYLKVSYSIVDKATKKTALSGDLMPMVANDGPHYGTTIRMPGVGKYQLKFTVSSPALARHTDKLTGVAEYWKPFDAQYDFEYAGLAKAK